MTTKHVEEGGLQLKEFSIALGQIAEEKGISEEKVLETVEAALAAAYKKDYGQRGQHIRSEFDQKSGQAKFFLVKEVVDDTTREFFVEEETIDDSQATTDNDGDQKKTKETQGADEEERLPRFNEERDIMLEDALKEKKDAKVGDIIEYALEPHDTFGRVAAQTAKQVIIQKIREAEREAMFKEFKEKEGEVISGTVQRIEGRTVFMDLGKSTGILLPSEQSSGDRYRIGQRLKVYVARVESDTRGPGVVLSRSHTELVRKLFELEVPEIFSGSVEVKAISREPGARTKIAVASHEEGVDPIGSCVGQKGTRVQAVIDELGGEKIDIIEWNENIEKFIQAALSPAKVSRLEVNVEEKQANVLVPQDQLSLAIGRQGQNVRLASRLVGYRIDVRGEEEVIENDADNEQGTTNSEQGEKKEVQNNENEMQNEEESSQENPNDPHKDEDVHAVQQGTNGIQEEKKDVKENHEGSAEEKKKKA